MTDLADLLNKANEKIDSLEFKIRELQTQIALQKGIIATQDAMLDEVKQYAEDQRYNQPTMSWSLRNTLKLKDCEVCGKLQEKCTCGGVAKNG